MLLNSDIDSLIQPVRDRSESRHPGRNFADQAAFQILERLGISDDLNRSLNIHGSPSRLLAASWLDNKASVFFRHFPKGQGIELACGLSSRFHRLSQKSEWPAFSWQMIDSSYVDGYLQHIYPALDNFRHLSSESSECVWPKILNWQQPRSVILLEGEQIPSSTHAAIVQLKSFSHAIRIAGIDHAELLIVHVGHSFKHLQCLTECHCSVLDETLIVPKLSTSQKIVQYLFRSSMPSSTYITHLKIHPNH